MLQYISVALAVLMNSDTAATEIDRVLNVLQPNDAKEELAVVDEIIKLLGSRSSPVIVLDGGKCLHWGYHCTGNVPTSRNFAKEGEDLVKLLKIPYFSTGMPKGGISETIDGKFGGIYGGGASTKAGSRNG
ncbi:Pyruvate decarboxylase isozyme 3 [Beauveria bassiana]|uniref:Pyruvate decarboxylase isozyme 3 n=1 Tax=Beauveria bassiana TaxID=176275 RepID=A0A2N6NYD9_BEABA|nr:Pyruvate decarboxylase isozyme 3 [Beauveria bassiana]